jgi:2-hydroxy-6-oxonona-2,4-dienedioate hydrolase
VSTYYDVISGNGKEIAIFLPGTGWLGDFGSPIAESLGENFVTHMLDLPGIGRGKGLEGFVKIRDAADWLDGYIVEKGLTKVTIIGHSLGGIVGLAYAYHYPDKVNRLILLDIGYAKIDRFPVKMMGSVGYIMPFISALHRIFGQRVLGKDTELSSGTQEDGRLTEEKIQQSLERMGLEDHPFIREALQNQPSTSREGIGLLLAAYRCPLPKLVRKLQVPCLILYGNRESDSEKVQNRVRNQIHQLKMAGIHVEELRGGHYAHVSDSRAVRLISSFLA